MHNMHCLRVINFTDNVDKKEAPVSEKNADCGYGKVLGYQNNLVTTGDGVKVQTKARNTTAAKKVEKRSKYCSPARKINYRSTSEVLGFRQKSIASLRTWSFANVKNKVKSVLKNNPISHTTKLKINEEQKNKICHKNSGKSKDDIKVLYSNERRKKKNSKRDFSPEVDRFLSKKSASVIFSAGRRPRQNSYLCYNTSRSNPLFPTVKRRKRKTKSKPCILPEALPLFMAKCDDQKCSPQSINLRDHYNLVGFPISSNTFEDQRLVYFPQCATKDQREAGTAGVDIDCEGDAKRKCPRCDLANKTVNNEPTLSIKKLPQAEVKKDTYFGSDQGAEQDEAVNRFFKIFKSTLKYTLLSLVVVAWLPCIIVIGACSLLVPSILCSKFFSCFSTQSGHENIFSNMMADINRNLRQIAFTVQGLGDENNVKEKRKRSHKKNIKKKTSRQALPATVAAIHRKKGSKWQPNPTRRYILYYDNFKGWLMKPFRNEAGEVCYQNPKINNITWCGPKCNKTVTFRDSTLLSENANKESNNIAKCLCSSELSPKAKQVNDSAQTFEDNAYELSPHALNNVHNESAPKIKRDASSNAVTIPSPPMHTPKPLTSSRVGSISQRKKLIIKQQPISRPVRRCKLCARNNFSRPCSPANCPILSKKEHPNSKKIYKTVAKKKVNKFKCLLERLKATIVDVDTQIWTADCGSLFMSTLRKKPCSWMFQCCPLMYPDFLAFYRSCANCCFCCCYLLSACIWCPIFIICYLCYAALMCCLCDW